MINSVKLLYDFKNPIHNLMIEASKSKSTPHE
jgi:hypothetical protein